ncbi:12367_t:CDS:1, partial [Cetraspora pellucida]
IQEEKNKIEGIKKQANNLDEMQITSNKKRSQEEITREADKDVVGKIALQFQTLDITSNGRHKRHRN